MSLNNTKILIGFFIVLITTGVFFTVKYGLVPRPIPKIRLSAFESPSEVAKSINQIIGVEIKNNSIWFLGFDPENKIQEELLKQFLIEFGIDSVIVDSNMHVEFQAKEIEKLDLKDQYAQLVKLLTEDYKDRKKTAIIGPAIYSAPGVRGNILYRLKDLATNATNPIQIGSLTFVQLVRNRANEKDVNIRCLTPETDVTGTGTLGCAILQESRLHYRKKLTPGKRAGSMDQRGALDFIFFYANEIETN